MADLCCRFGDAAALAIGIRAMMMLGNSETIAAQDASGPRARGVGIGCSRR